MAVFPPKLRAGGTIGVVAPARWPDPQWLVTGKAALESRGYKVVIHPQNMAQDGQLAGSDNERAQALMAMFADPAIDAILCSRGGTGAIRILDKLDYDLIRSHPKSFVGFSDITSLLQAINVRADLVTYHGPMLWNFAQQPEAGNLDDLFALLTQSSTSLKFDGVEIVQPGQIEGRLVGGNMSLLRSLIGTSYDWNTDGAILFMEDVDEVIYKLDVILQQFRLAGKFDKVRAVLVGEMVDVKDGETGYARLGERSYGKTLRQIFREAIPAHIPLAFNLPCGHGLRMTTLPIGAQAHLTLKDTSAELDFKPA